MTNATLHPDERHARIQLASCYNLPDAHCVLHTHTTAGVAVACLRFNPNHGGGQDVFNALVRQVDRLDTSYQQ